MTEPGKSTYLLVSLGCPKNLVDSESMAEIMNRQGLSSVEFPDQAEYIIVNTCGFLKAAREEAITVLTDLASEKKPWQKLIATGCMTEHHRGEIVNSVPGVDGFLGTRRWMDILKVMSRISKRKHSQPIFHFPETAHVGRDEKGTHRAAIQGGSAYLKIADGCRRSCSYCMIPMIKGNLVSRSIEKILDDARVLQDRGVQEIILIAQDTTDYGHDIGLKDGITQLIEALLKAVPAVPWIRLMYTFPGYVSENLIQIMATESQVLPYLDMPLQHAEPTILQSMRRPSNMMAVRKTLSDMRNKIEDIALRTTFIVGYPGEDDKSFQELINFIQYVRFDHVGGFTYSFEPGTPAESLGDPIPEAIKFERLEHLMTVQSEISLERNEKLIGKKFDVLVEGVDDQNNISIGRSYRDAPEVDGLVVIEGIAPVGKIVKVKINSAITHDLVGELVQAE